MLITADPILGRLQKHFEENGIKSTVLEKRLDFELDFIDANLLGTTDGIGSVGSLQLTDSPIDYVNIVKKQKYVNCDFAMGGSVGMGIHLHSWYKMRFFISIPETFNLGPFDIGTISTIKKGLFQSKVESFVWSGYQKLTTLPPGLVRDNVADALYSDPILKKLMTECLVKERIILVSRYSPPTIKKAFVTNSKIKIDSTWKLQKDLFVDKSSLEMYETIAQITKDMVYNLKYHLT